MPSAEEKRILAGRFYRTMVHVRAVGQKTIKMEVPGWRVDKVLTKPIDMIPESIREGLKPGRCLWCECNVLAEESKDLVFKNWRSSSR